MRWRGLSEDLLDASAGTFDNFAGAFGSAHAHILAADDCAFADLARAVERMQRDNIADTLPGVFCSGAHASTGTFADVPGATAHVATGTAALRLRDCRRSRLDRLGVACGCLGLSVSSQTGSAQYERRDIQVSLHSATSTVFLMRAVGRGVAL